ncbi:MAG: hypothetical protein ABSH39_16275 [Candidatus Acidiferrum sp.]|jgi:hypothetical protein
MKRPLSQIAIALLRWTLGLVVIVESVRFIFSSGVAHFLAEARVPVWIQPALGATEILAAVLFLIRFTEPDWRLRTACGVCLRCVDPFRAWAV